MLSVTQKALAGIVSLLPWTVQLDHSFHFDPVWGQENEEL